MVAGYCRTGDEFGWGNCGAVCGRTVAWANMIGCWSCETVGGQRWRPGMDFGLKEESFGQRCQPVQWKHDASRSTGRRVDGALLWGGARRVGTKRPVQRGGKKRKLKQRSGLKMLCL